MIEVVEREYEVERGLKVVVSNVNGQIKIKGYDGDTLKLKAEKKWGLLSSEPKIKVKKEGNTLKISAHFEKSVISFGSRSVNFDILVPKDVEVEKVSSVNGQIQISDISGILKVSNVNGSIKVENAEVKKLSSVNGSIVAILRKIKDDSKISTVNGSIKVYIPPKADAEIFASTTNGSIRFDIPGMKIEGTKIRFGPKSAVGVLGDGKYKIKVSTVNGSISVSTL